MNTFRPSKDPLSEHPAAEKSYWQGTHSFRGLQVFICCIGLSVLATILLSVITLFKGGGLPDFGTLESIGVGVLGIYMLRQRSEWGYWLAMLYSAGAFFAGCWMFAGSSGLFSKVLGLAVMIFGIYFMAYFYSRRHFFD
jgi:hypothetical protein